MAMLGRHHEATANLALDLVGADRQTRENVVRGATFPDAVADIYVQLLGKRRYSLFDQGFAAFDHYSVLQGRTFRGYSWPLDPSAKWLELPNVDVGVDTAGWMRELWPCASIAGQEVWSADAHAWAARHPEVQLLAVEGRTKAMDETCYASGVAMAVWLEELLGLSIPLEYRCRAMGCILHMIHDAAMKPHAEGLLMRGHTTHEARSWELFQENRKALQRRVAYRPWPGARRAVEQVARVGRGLAPLDGARLGLRWSCIALSSWL